MSYARLQNNQNTSNFRCCLFQEPILFYLLPPILILIIVLGSIFNFIALWAFCFHIKSWKASTVYLFNLSMADFLLIIILPFRTDYYLKQEHWIYGDVPCRVMLFMLAMNRAGSIFFLTLVGLDRYFRVVHPHNNINSLSTKTAALISCGVWFTTIAMTALILTEDHLQEDPSSNKKCKSFMVCPAASCWHDLIFILQFFLPLCIILFCSYSIIWRLRQRNLDRDSKIRKSVKCIISVGIVFIICFLPSVSTRIEILRLLASPQMNDCSIYRTVDTAFYITVCLTYMNSMCNPLVYFFSSPSFSIFYLKIMRCSNQSDSDAVPTITNNITCNNQQQTQIG
ncbi:hydroxycarboxylic acid receptor 2-like [Bufo bufo]|uniref:hydroxycarboxylic acid receptor 2-like n=1 Tax=Bufo bufo TaxID=8384 RepID=UPI001ABE0183|nr:hydroxycarboxylic acid receptor 2-like [Bufo bufo]